MESIFHLFRYCCEISWTCWCNLN